MDWDRIKKKLQGSEQDINQESSIDGEDDESPIQIADESPWSNVYKAASPVLDAIIPSADAARLSEFKPENIRVIKPSADTNQKKSLQQHKQANINQQSHQMFTPPSTDEIKQFIADEARKRGQDPALVLAHFEKESSFNPSSYNKKGGGMGARGLAQVRKDAFTDAQKFDKSGALKNLSMKDMSNPKYWKENVQAGLNYYDAIKKYWKPKNTKSFLKSYNQGSPSAQGYHSQEAEDYANDVLSRYNKHKEYVNQLDAQRELASTKIDSGEELAADKINLIKNLKGLMNR